MTLRMIDLSPAPSWLPLAVQPEDWLVLKICGILLIGFFVAGVGAFLKGGDPDV